MKRVLVLAFLAAASCSQFQKQEDKNNVFVSGRIEGDDHHEAVVRHEHAQRQDQREAGAACD